MIEGENLYSITFYLFHTQPPPDGSWWVEYRRNNRRPEEKAAGSRWFVPRVERPSGGLKPPTNNQSLNHAD